MKKILFLNFIVSLFLIGCSKDSDNNNSSLVGKWQTNKIYSQIYLNNVLKGSDTSTAGSVEFANNGSFTSIDDNNDTSRGTYTYNTSSKIITAISDSDTSHFNVTNLTSNNLHFKGDETDVMNGTLTRTTVDADYKR